jgi:hypothetical protein
MGLNVDKKALLVEENEIKPLCSESFLSPKLFVVEGLLVRLALYLWSLKLLVVATYKLRLVFSCINLLK